MTRLPSLLAHGIFASPGLDAVFAAIAQAGGEARIVGGAVRNALLGEPVEDIDFAATLLPEQLVAAARAAGLKVVPTGIDHGTVTIISKTIGYEVTTLRQDLDTDGRHANVAFTDDWAADAARRDFTLNALYCDSAGNVHDPLDGYADLLARTIRFVGDADLRISEDYLRILRFFRFVSSFGDGEPDAEALAACGEHKGGLGKLSRERIGQEMRKLLLGRRAGFAAGLMNGAGVSKVLFGTDLNHATLTRTKECAGRVAVTADFVTLLAGALPLPSAELAGLLRLSNADTKALDALQNAVPFGPGLRDHERKVVLYQTGVETWRRAVLLSWADAAVAENGADDADWQALYRLPDEWEIPELPVTGADVIAAGVAAGPKVGETLRALEDWWVAGGFVAGREELLGRINSEQ